MIELKIIDGIPGGMGRGCWTLNPTVKGYEIQKMNIVGAARTPAGRTVLHLCPHLAWKEGKAATTTSSIWLFPEEIYYTRSQVFKARLEYYQVEVDNLQLRLRNAANMVAAAKKRFSQEYKDDNKA